MRSMAFGEVVLFAAGDVSGCRMQRELHVFLWITLQNVINSGEMVVVFDNKRRVCAHLYIRIVKGCMVRAESTH